MLVLRADPDPFQVPVVAQLDAAGLEEIDEGGHGLAAVLRGGADGGRANQRGGGVQFAPAFALTAATTNLTGLIDYSSKLGQSI